MLFRPVALSFVVFLGACGGVSGQPGQNDGDSDNVGTDDDIGGGGDDDDLPLPTYNFTRVDNTTCQMGNAATTAYRSTRVWNGLTSGSLTSMVPVPGGDGLVAIAEQAGRVVVIDPQNPTRTVALDVAPRVMNQNEKGFLSIAFAPDFDTSGHLYAAYSVLEGPSAEDLRVARYACTRVNGLTCDAGSEHDVIVIDRPAENDNHNGGQIFFGADDLLYVSTGDSGGGGDPYDWAQNRTRVQGKLLRIAPNDTTYAIPDGNPYKNNTQGFAQEIYAYGLRNPWRCSNDGARIFCADVGQGDWEEIDIIVNGGNYGWNKREGRHDYGGRSCTAGDACIDPIHEYGHTNGRVSVTGGYVYRGTSATALLGAYVFADYATGEVWRLDESAGNWAQTLLFDGNGGVTSFGRDTGGELYTLHNDGAIRRIEQTGSTDPVTIPATLSATGCFSDIPSQTLVAAALPYDVRVPFWSDDAAKKRYVVLPNGTRMSGSVSNAWQFPIGTIVIKQFTYADQPIETRFLVQRAADTWEGFSYKWNDAHTDAALLDDEETVAYGDHLHFFPSRGACETCHTASGGRVLGLRTEQTNIDNQIPEMVRAGFLNMDTSAPAGWPALVPASDAAADVYAKARSYLAANCSQCHNGVTRFPNMRYSVALADSELCEVIVPGSAATSPIIANRMSVRGEPYGTIGAGQMPPLATFLRDDDGIAIVSAWIDAMDDGTLPATAVCTQ